MELTLSTFMQKSTLAGVPAKVKAFQQLAAEHGSDPTKALVEITLNVPDDLVGYGLEVKEPELAGEGVELTPDELALIDAACAEYAQLPVEVRSVLNGLDIKALESSGIGKPGPSIHSAKWDRCIEHVKANSPDVNAYAVCTATLGSQSMRSVFKGVSQDALHVLQVLKDNDQVPGIDQSTIAMRAGYGDQSLVADRLNELQSAGLAKQIGRNWRATDRGMISVRSVSQVAMDMMAKMLQLKSTPHTKQTTHPDLIARGGSLKAMPDGWVYGCAVLFTDPSRKDLTGDYFTKSTELAWQGLEPRIALYHHGMDSTFKDAEFKNGWQLDRIDDVGLWVKHQCDMRDEYEAAVYGMVKSKKLGLSSGAASHLVKRADDGQLLRWPISEISYTPTPAEPGTMVQAIKSLGQVKTFAELSGLKFNPLENFMDDLDNVITQVSTLRGTIDGVRQPGNPAPLEFAKKAMGDALKQLQTAKIKLQNFMAEEGKSVKPKSVNSQRPSSKLAQALSLTTLTEQDQQRVLKAIELATGTKTSWADKGNLEAVDQEILEFLDGVISASAQDIARKVGIRDNVEYLLQNLESMGYVSQLGSSGSGAYRITNRGQAQL